MSETEKKAYADGFEKGSHVTLQTVMAWLDAHGGDNFAAALSAASHDHSLEHFRPDTIREQAPHTLAVDPL